MPKKQYFDGQHEDEDVLMVFRRHPVVMRKGLLAILAFLLISMIPITIWPTNLNLLWGVPAGLLLGGVFMFYSWIGWYFSVVIVTNQRFIQVSQKGFWNTSVVDIGLDKIQNVNFQVAGMQETLLGFGTLLVQTYVGDLQIDQVYHPEKVQSRIVKIIKDLGIKSFTPAPGDEEVTQEEDEEE